ncbi:MAG TPA: phage shock protein PspA [Alphaproteobacteria bacterium]|nr:phage shock protein PspA [Alphaproteobacteria bacterium]
MGIFSRLTDIVNSNINALLDQAEDPEKMVRLIIQEMEETLVEVRSTAARIIADQKDMDRKLKRADEAMSEWQRKAELALSRDREDLAKGALIERSKVADMKAHIEEEREHLAEQLSHLEGDIVKLEGKLREAKAKKSSIQTRHESVSQKIRVRRSLYDGRITDAFERFEKMEHRLDRLEGEAESMDIGRGKTLSEQIDDLETIEDIEGELEALKAKMNKSKPAANTDKGK